MKLTGKCLDAFVVKYYNSKNNIALSNTNLKSMPDVLLNALIIEFFDSVGIYISIKLSIINFEAYVYDNYIGRHKTRTEATNEAIIKANDLFNENN